MMTEINDAIRKELKNRRIGAIDYGKKRLGFAVCDELHISITPLKVFAPASPGFWEELINIIDKENVKAVVVGIPYRHDDKTTELIEEIEGFINKLKEKSDIDIYTYDEAFSTHRAVDAMLQIGKKKKNRARKGSKDLIAAAIILRDFLNELE